MKMRWWCGWIAMAAIVLGFHTTLAAETPAAAIHGIPEIADPPPTANGELDRMQRVPGWTTVHGAEHVDFGKDKWKNDADLSASVILGWRQDYLYVAARVKDDVVVQPYSGERLWKGDHVILLLDVPRQMGGRQKSKVFQIGLSPGDLVNGGPAQVYQWTPNSREMTDARVGARKTADGYQIEAAIPWKALGVDQGRKGMRFGYDVMLSDTDSKADPMQDKIMSLLIGPWELRNPDRLVEGVLAGSDGKVDPAWVKPPFDLIRSNIQIGPESTVTVDAAIADHKPVKELIVRGRIDFASVAGGNHILQVKLNGKMLEFNRIRNRLVRFELGDGEMASCQGDNTWFLLFSPNFNPIPEYSGYATPGIDPFELRFDVSDLWKSDAKNVVELINITTIRHPVIAEVGVSELLSAKLEPPQLRPAPTGEIPTIVPIITAKPQYTFRQLPGGAIEVKLGAQRWVVESAFSTTTPGWANLAENKNGKSEWNSLNLDQSKLTAKARDFELQRTIIRHDDHLQVVDRITNTTGDLLPVMFAHHVRVDRKSGTLYISGLPTTQPKVNAGNGAYPVTLMMYGQSGLGLVSEDDITRAQGTNFADNDLVGIRDDRLALDVGGSVVLEYSIYPVDSGDFFTFINRVRRNWDVNFTVNGPGMFAGDVGPTMNIQMTDERLKDYLQNKSARYALNASWLFNFDIPSWKPQSRVIAALEMMKRIHAVRPDIQRLDYFHCYLGFQAPWDLTDENVETQKRLFAADAIRRPDGTPADYSNPKLPLFLPVESSAWARANESLIDYRLQHANVEGIYWDEIPYSAVVYDYNPDHWDGVSADINRTTHRIERKVTNVTLASQPWRLKMAKKILSHGLLIGNSAPHTRSFTRVHFPRFVETGLFANIVNCQLYTPIALGDHLTERTEADAYQDMVRGLDYGAVYYWYRGEVDATYPTLTSCMFPITPINLGRGYIIGHERILTNTSGYFGWGDQSDFHAVVFDRRGNKTDEIRIAKVLRGGRTFAEVRIPEGYSVAILRKMDRN